MTVTELISQNGEMGDRLRKRSNIRTKGDNSVWVSGIWSFRECRSSQQSKDVKHTQKEIASLWMSKCLGLYDDYFFDLLFFLEYVFAILSLTFDAPRKIRLQQCPFGWQEQSVIFQTTEAPTTSVVKNVLMIKILLNKTKHKQKQL